MSNVQMTIGVPVTKIRHLTRTLASVAVQTVPVKLVVVDNGADGDVEKFVLEMRKENVEFIRRPKQLPPVANWNALLETVASPWFILLSDDDYLEPDHVERILRLADAYPEVDVVHARMRIVDENESLISYSPAAPEWESAIDFLWHRVRGYRVQFLSDFAWHTEALRSAGGFASMPSAWGTDDLTALRLARRGGIACSAVATVGYRVHGGSITSGRGLTGKLKAVRLLVTEYREFCLQSRPLGTKDADLASDLLDRLCRFESNQMQDLMAASAWGELFTRDAIRFGLPDGRLPKAILRKLKRSLRRS